MADVHSTPTTTTHDEDEAYRKHLEAWQIRWLDLQDTFVDLDPMTASGAEAEDLQFALQIRVLVNSGGVRPLDPKYTFEEVLKAWDHELNENTNTDPKNGRINTIRAFGPRPHEEHYPGADLRARDRRILEGRAYEELRSTVQPWPETMQQGGDAPITEVTPPPTGATRPVPTSRHATPPPPPPDRTTTSGIHSLKGIEDPPRPSPENGGSTTVSEDSAPHAEHLPHFNAALLVVQERTTLPPPGLIHVTIPGVAPPPPLPRKNGDAPPLHPVIPVSRAVTASRPPPLPAPNAAEVLASKNVTIKGPPPPPVPAPETRAAPSASVPDPAPTSAERRITPQNEVVDDILNVASVPLKQPVVTFPPPAPEPDGPVTEPIPPPKRTRKALTWALAGLGMLCVAALLASSMLPRRTSRHSVVRRAVAAPATIAQPVTPAVPQAPSPAPSQTAVTNHCLAQAGMATLSDDEKIQYFACRYLNTPPLFYCHVSSVTADDRANFCAQVIAACQIVPDGTATDAQIACLADPRQHELELSH